MSISSNTQTRIIGSLIAAFILSAIVAFSAPISQVSADTYTPNEPTKEITIDKMVGRPSSTQNGTTDYTFFDNLTSNDYSFTADQIVFFRIKVKNTSQAKLTDVIVKDFKPSYVSLINDPGTVTDGTLQINAGNFEPGEEKVYIIRGRVESNNDNIPAGTTCVSNTARAEANGVSSQDTAQFCIRKPGTTEEKGGTVAVPTKVPATGASDTLLVLSSAIGFAVAGFKLRKLA